MVKILTDSACDIDRQRLDELDVEVLPITIHFGNETFAQGFNIDNRTFYDKLKAAKQLPTTSQIPPAAFEEAFSRHIDNGDEVVGVFLSSKLSGTVQSARIARESVSCEKVFVVDSLSATLGLGLMVFIAADLRDKGKSAREIADELTQISEKITIYAFVDTLKYLKMSGRLSAASAAVGTFLSITPLITLGNGMVESIGKTRGREAAFKRVAELFSSCERDERYQIAIGHADEPAHIDRMLAALGGEFSRDNAHVFEIGGTICVHIGTGAAGVAFVKK